MAQPLSPRLTDPITANQVHPAVSTEDRVEAGYRQQSAKMWRTLLAYSGDPDVALWQWHGTKTTGNPFELAGISLATYDEDGRVSYELVAYPYPDAYVREASMGSGN